jgi:hypothetical protein
MYPANIQCQSDDLVNKVALPSCVTVDASTQVDCVTGGALKAIPCISIDASQVRLSACLALCSGLYPRPRLLRLGTISSSYMYTPGADSGEHQRRGYGGYDSGIDIVGRHRRPERVD